MAVKKNSAQRIKIVLTGGGSAGHVTPNLAIIPKLQHANWNVYYIGSKRGIEREIIGKVGLPYFGILSGKLRRYFSWQNFIDPFKIIIATFQAYFLCRKIKPQVVFSKGGFVAFPVVIAAWLNRIPVVAHESDITPGLANRLSFPFVQRICVSYPETQKHIGSKYKVEVTGAPIREEILSGDASRGRELCGFDQERKIILVVGGGLGSAGLNRIMREALPLLLEQYQVAHVCGEGLVDNSLNMLGYKQFSYLHAEYFDVLACADLVISRGGANSIFELVALFKPHILVPLPTNASRGDQVLNAAYFEGLNISAVIPQQELTATVLEQRIQWVMQHREELVAQMQGFKGCSGAQAIYVILAELTTLRR